MKPNQVFQIVLVIAYYLALIIICLDLFVWRPLPN